MQIDSSTQGVRSLPKNWLAMSSSIVWWNVTGIFTAIKSSRWTNGEIFNILRNGSTHSGGAQMTLYDFIEQKDPASPLYTYQEVNAPEECIYRHDHISIQAISNIFDKDPFNGDCDVAYNFDSGHCKTTHEFWTDLTSAMNTTGQHGGLF